MLLRHIVFLKPDLVGIDSCSKETLKNIFMLGSGIFLVIMSSPGSFLGFIYSL